MIKSLSSAVLARSVCILLAQSAWSQESSAPTVQSGTLEEVIVTAQKRSENLQNVPLSITALGGKLLEQINSVSLVDFARRVPGLSFSATGPGENNIVVRGISSADAQLRQTTGYYLDETPVSALGMGAIDADLFDLERIEVLRGPQGTLYGSGSMGGTVRLITAKPDFSKFSAHSDVSTAETAARGQMSEAVNGAVNVPLSDSVAFHAVGYFREDGGWIGRARPVMTYNPFVPSQYQADLRFPVEKDVNSQQTGGVRASLGIRAGDSLTITPSIFFQHITTDGRPEYDDPPGSPNNQIQTRLVAERIADTFTLSNITAKYSGSSLELLSSTSYFDRTRFDVDDVSTVPLFFFYPLQTTLLASPYDLNLRNHAFTEELRGSTTGEGPLHLIVGVFYTDGTSHQGTFSRGPGFSQAVFPIVDDIFSESEQRTNTREKALFGELSYRIVQNLTLTVGARAFKSETESDGTRGGFAVSPQTGGGVTIIVPPINQSESGVNPKYQLSWQATSNALVYGTAAQGFRAGGVNGPFPTAFCGADLAALGLTQPPDQFKADKLWNYELGGKTRWLDNRLTVNGAVYYINWKEVQQSVSLPCGYSFLGNFGSAKSRGAELEVTSRVFSRLALSTGIGYNKAELTGVGLPGVAGKPGDPLENAPRWTVNGAADYSVPLSATYTAGVSLNYQYTSEVFGSFDPTNPDYHRPGFGTMQLNAHIDTNKFEYSLFVNNLTDSRAQTAFAGNHALNIPGVRVVVPLRPRTVGLRFAIKY